MSSLLAARPAAHGPAALPPIRAVIFDLDGTLFDTEPLYRAAFHAALSRFGFALDDARYAGLIGLATPDRAERLAQLFGRDFPAPAFLAEYRRQKQRCLATPPPLKPGALALLDWLAERGLPAAVASAASAATVHRHLARAGLTARFAAILSRDDVARRKPHPDLFLQAAGALGVKPCHCLVLEDSAPGLAAAAAAGMQAVLIPDLAPLGGAIRHKSLAILSDLHAVRALLAGP